MAEVGKREVRVDAFDKATGRTKYYEDLMPRDALYVRIRHSTIAHGFVKSVDKSAAEAIPGVVKVLTCFDVPEHPFPTAGHPWSMDPGHQDVADRHLLNRHVRYYGDDVAVVIAENEVAAMQGVRALQVEYEELPLVLDAQEAMKPGAPQLHEAFPNNILKHTDMKKGDYQAAIQEPGLIKVEGWYDTPTVQHCHIENHGCFAYEENGRITVVASTQIPHIIRRVVGQALGRPWSDIRVVKPYIGGGFGNKQDALYEPLCAWCSTQVQGRCVRIDCSREETFVSNRVRHAIRFHIVSWLRPDGTFAARKVELFSNQGAYASHGHSIVAKAMGSFPQHYPCDNMECDAWTVFTNRPAAGAMRGYGMPQASFADEANVEDCAKAVGMDPLAFRMQNVMPQGYEDGFSHNVNYDDSFRQCLEAGKKYIDYDKKLAEFAKDTGPIRRGICPPPPEAGRGPGGVLVQHRRVSHLPGDLLQPDAAESGRQRHHAVRRDGDRPGGRHRLCPDGRRCGGPGGLSQGPCGVLPGHGHHPHGPGRLRLPPDVCGRVLHPPDGPAAEGEDPGLRRQAHPPGGVQHGHRGRQYRPHHRW